MAEISNFSTFQKNKKKFKVWATKNAIKDIMTGGVEKVYFLQNL